MKKRDIIVLSIFTILVIIIKSRIFSIESRDYKIFLDKWIEHMKNNGGINSLKETFTDYNYPYLIFLALISYIPIKSVFFIKILSCIFDVLLAIVGYKIVYECIDDSKKRIRNAKIAYVFLICLPTVLLNSSYWGQCDSIYSFFVLLSIYYLIKEDIIYSFIFLGVAFSFKLQFIFILPVFVILMFLGKKIKIYHFLIIPITNFIMCIPAYIVGGSPLYTYKIYFLQTKEYGLSAPTTNIYNFLSQDNNIIYAGVIISLLLFLILLIYYYLNDTLFDKNKIIDLSLISVMMCYFFLPSMHERYSYLIDVISVIWIFVRGKYIFIPIIVNLCSLSLYLEYLIGFKLTLNYHKELAILFFICIISMLFIINNTMKEKYKM